LEKGSRYSLVALYFVKLWNGDEGTKKEKTERKDCRKRNEAKETIKGRCTSMKGRTLPL
jgi:hypothetical protein